MYNLIRICDNYKSELRYKLSLIKNLFSYENLEITKIYRTDYLADFELQNYYLTFH